MDEAVARGISQFHEDKSVTTHICGRNVIHQAICIMKNFSSQTDCHVGSMLLIVFLKIENGFR
jgi:hypothetical protein